MSSTMGRSQSCNKAVKSMFMPAGEFPPFQFPDDGVLGDTKVMMLSHCLLPVWVPCKPQEGMLRLHRVVGTVT